MKCFAKNFVYLPSVERGDCLWDIYEQRKFLWMTRYIYLCSIRADMRGTEILRHLDAKRVPKQENN